MQAGHWTALAPPVDGPVGQFAHELAVLAEDRQHELGQAALADPPAWAVAQLGPVPSYDDLTAQVDAGDARWRSGPSTRSRPRGSSGRSGPARSPRTGSCAASTREATSIGAAPSREEEFHRQMWTQANAALGHDVDAGAVDYRTMADLDLYQVRDRWTREQAWAPAYVAEEMRTAYQLGREYTEDAALAGARLAQLEPDDPAWEQTAAQLERSQRLADLNLERARQLDEIHHARGGWYDSTEDARVADELARAELERRGLPAQRELDRGEQLELFDPTDLDVDQHAQADLEVDIRVDVEPTMDAIVEPALEAQPAHEAEVAAQAREPVDVERALEDAHAELAPTAERVAHDPRQVELHLEDGVELDVELDDVELEQQNDAAQTPAPAAADEPERAISEAVQLEPVQPELEQPGRAAGVEQLALLEVEPDIADEVGAQPLRAPEPDRPPSRRGKTPRTRSGNGRSRPGSPWPRRAGRPRPPTPSGKPARLPRTAVRRPGAGHAGPPGGDGAPRTTAERARDEEPSARNSSNRWHEQDRADELDRGLDDGPGLGMG